MRYRILKPQSAIDPRDFDFANEVEMTVAWPVVAECDSEVEAVRTVRWHFPDAVAMPAPVDINGKSLIVLGILERVVEVSEDRKIPFVMFVQAIPDAHLEQHLVKKNKAFAMKLWKPPVVKPTQYAMLSGVELRSRDLQLPTRPTCIVGRERGKLVVYLELDGIDMSIAFDDPNLVLVRGDAHHQASPTSEAKVTVDGDGTSAA